MEFAHALLEALGEERFIEYVARYRTDENSEDFNFVVESRVFYIRRKNGKWWFGYYTDKDMMWKMMGKEPLLYISV